MRLSLIIPSYNEEKRFVDNINLKYKFFKEKLKDDFELIIVPNNCKDKTPEMALEFAKDKKNVRVHIIPNYSGKGGAVIKGFELAEGDLIGFIDTDNSTTPEEFIKLYQNIGDHHGIIASRKLKDSLIIPKRKFHQDASSFLFNKFVNLFFNLGYKDTQCGAKLFKKPIAKYLIKNYSEEHWGFDVDLLYLCKKKNLKILEYPIIWSDSEHSVLTLKASLTTVFRLMKYRLKNL